MNEFSVIILLHNHEYNKAQEKSEVCLEGLFKYTTTPFQLVLVDNGSTDPKTKKWFEELEPQGACTGITRVVRYPNWNTCFSAGANEGIEHARHEILAFINNDVVWNDSCINWAEKMSNGFLMGDNVAMVCVPLTFKKAFDYGLDSDKWIALFGFTMMKKEVVNYVGYLDERYLRGNFDDDDFNIRIRRMGFRIVCEPSIKPEHDWRTSALEHYKRTENIFEKNRLKFNDKWKRFGYFK